ncbi:Fe(3+) ABC transporter substrate-binding protein [Aestuariivirga sp.]|uniref:Fe(3+) ABC transporter substrate-binding protein n=1 Tax=Aestuariivirga sp. TaxID=2650926 RepID=UPI0039E2520E
MFKAARLLALFGSALLCSTAAFADGVVNVYSYRQPQLVQPLFDAFKKETGIEVKMVFAEKGLIERMEQEGALSPVDVLLTADVGRLVEAADKGLGQPIADDKITGKVPAALRDPGNQWFGLTMRARVVYASKERVKQDTISYEELADPKWKGKICTRPGDHPYNLGLIGAMIAKRGEVATKTWLEGLKANLAVKPSGNDRAQAKSVAAGECDLAIGNTYYMGLMMTNEKEPEQKQWAAASRIIFPSSPEMGTHVNISGMLMAKNAPHRDDALKLMEFLASDESQALYASQNFEYPVNPAIKPSEIVASWGSFTPDSVNIMEVARNQKAAAQLVNEVQFND